MTVHQLQSLVQVNSVNKCNFKIFGTHGLFQILKGVTEDFTWGYGQKPLEYSLSVTLLNND